MTIFLEPAKCFCVCFLFMALMAQKRKPRAGPGGSPHPIRAHLQKYFVKFFLHCNKLVLNLYPTNLITNTMTTTTTEKTGFKIVFEQHLSFMQPYEIIGLTVYDTYAQAMRIGKEVCKDMSSDSRNTIIKYIIAIPVVETVEIEHINYLS